VPTSGLCPILSNFSHAGNCRFGVTRIIKGRQKLTFDSVDTADTLISNVRVLVSQAVDSSIRGIEKLVKTLVVHLKKNWSLEKSFRRSNRRNNSSRSYPTSTPLTPVKVREATMPQSTGLVETTKMKTYKPSKPETLSEHFQKATKKTLSVLKTDLQRREISHQQMRKNKHRKRHR